MPKRVTTIATTVVREGKRKEVAAKTAFDFTKDEIADLNRIHPGALRMPVNESAEDEATDETAPEKTKDATANKPNKTPAKKAAAAKDSTSKEATDGDKGDAGGESDAKGDGTADEDDDI